MVKGISLGARVNVPKGVATAALYNYRAMALGAVASLQNRVPADQAPCKGAPLSASLVSGTCRSSRKFARRSRVYFQEGGIGVARHKDSPPSEARIIAERAACTRPPTLRYTL